MTRRSQVQTLLAQPSRAPSAAGSCLALCCLAAARLIPIVPGGRSLSHLRHAAGITGLRTDAVDVMMDDGEIALPVVGDVSLLGAGQVEVDVAPDLQMGAVQHPFVLQTEADSGVDLGPHLVCGSENRRSGPQVRIEVEPELRCLPAEFVTRRLQDAIAELTERTCMNSNVSTVQRGAC